MLEELFVFCSG